MTKGPIESQGEIQGSLSNLMDSVGSLSCSIDRLHDKVRPVIDNTPEPCEESVEEPYTGSDVMVQIHDIARLVNSMIPAVDKINSDCQL